MKINKQFILEIVIILLITAAVILGGIYLPASLLGAKFNNVDDYTASVKSDAVQPYGAETLALEGRLIEVINQLSNAGSDSVGIDTSFDYDPGKNYKLNSMEDILAVVARNYSYNIHPDYVQTLHIAGNDTKLIRVQDFNDDFGIRLLMNIDEDSGIVMDGQMAFECMSLKYSNLWEEIKTIYTEEVGMTFLDSSWDVDGLNYTYEAVTVDGRLALNMQINAELITKYTPNDITAYSYNTYAYQVVFYLSEK